MLDPSWRVKRGKYGNAKEFGHVVSSFLTAFYLAIILSKDRVNCSETSEVSGAFAIALDKPKDKLMDTLAWNCPWEIKRSRGHRLRYSR